MRQLQLDMSGQEIMTKDKIMLRVNSVGQYRIQDPVKALNPIKNYKEVSMFKRHSAAIRFIGALIAGAGLFIAADLADAGDNGAARQARILNPSKQKIEPVKALGSTGPLAKPLGAPVAYGFVQWDGSLRSSSGNIKVEWDANGGRYLVHIAGVAYHAGPFITFVTAEGMGGIYLPATTEDNDALVIRIGKITGEPGIQAGFQFVSYKVG